MDDEENYFIRCIDLSNMPDEEICPICQISHEVMFDFDEDIEIDREEIESDMERIANLIAYLKGLLD